MPFPLMIFYLLKGYKFLIYVICVIKILKISIMFVGSVVVKGMIFILNSNPITLEFLRELIV